MAVKYKIKKFVHGNSKENGKFYARAISIDELDIYGIAELIQERSSLTKGDVMAVLVELVDVMKMALHDSKKVRINGFGIFKMAIKSHLVDKAEDITAKNINGYRVIFSPEYKKDINRKHKIRLTQGAKAEPLEDYINGLNDVDLPNRIIK